MASNNNLVYISQFNKQSHEFLSKMEATFPDEEKIKKYKFMFDGIKQLSPKTPVEMFMTNLQSFGVQIMSKDETFFKNDQYVNNVESMSGKLGLVDRWNNIPTETKNSIWNYMQILYVLGMKSLDRLDELSEIIKIVNSQKIKQ